MNKSVYLIEAKRTPLIPKISTTTGSSFSSSYLLTTLVRAIVESGPWRLDEIGGVIVGKNQLPPTYGHWLRELLIESGYPKEWKSKIVTGGNGAGFDAIIDGVTSLAVEDLEAIVVGGIESWSECSEWAGKLNHVVQQVGQREGFWKKLTLLGEWSIKELSHLGSPPREKQEGEWLELLAQELKVSREEQDVWAHQSHVKAIRALQEGVFEQEIVPIVVGEMEKLLTKDQGPRRDCNLETLQKSRPYYSAFSATLTEGNGSLPSDGGAMLLLANESFVQNHQLRPMARVVKCIRVGTDPKRSPLGMAYALSILLNRANLSLEEVDLFEMDELWALNILATLKVAQNPGQLSFFALPHLLGSISPEKINSWGGSIALGHPLAANGPRLLVTLAHRLRYEGKRWGVACISEIGGISSAILIENSMG